MDFELSVDVSLRGCVLKAAIYSKIFSHVTLCEKFNFFTSGTEGKAGMAAIMDPDKVVDMNDFYDGVCKMLVSYARPLFVRICNYVEVTG